MIETNGFKKGVCLVYKGAPMIIVDVTFSTPTARGSNTIAKTKLRNLLTGQLITESIRSGEKFGEVDLERDPIWFGTPRLPERVDAEIVRRERQLAEAAGITPFPAATVQEALERGGQPLAASDFTALSRYAWQLFRRFTPEAAVSTGAE